MPERLNSDTLTEDELKISYWYITHKVLIRNITFYVFIGINVILLLFVFYRLTDNYILQWNSHKNGLTGLSMASQSLAAMNPQVNNGILQLEFGETQVLVGNDDSSDIITEIYNPNQKYIGYFEYQYETIAGSSLWRKGFVIPGETKFIHELGYKPGERIFNASINIRNFKWDQVLQFEQTAEERLNFEIEQTEYIPNYQSEVSENVAISKVESKFVNNSAFSYRQVGFLIVLYRGQQVVGVNYIKLDNVEANSSYELEASWFYDVGSVQEVVIMPEVNILNPAVYKSLR